MGRFYPLYVRRSDGKAEIISKGQRKKEINQPTEEQLDQRPDKNGISDYYREVAPEEPKHLDWRRKIGGMLARELNWKDKGGDSGYILATFPENYRLYEHVKKTVVDGKTEVKSKTHGAGGNDRQDAYLYGHPLGRRKRFRSPGDFFAHVLWLSTDESGDPDNCTCKICSPEDLENLIPSMSVSVSRNRTPDARTAGAQVQAATTRPSSAQNANTNANVKVKMEPTTPMGMPRPSSAAPATRTPAPTPLPQKKSQDQFDDSQYRSFMYRPAELIWFQRGQAWGLGVIVRRWGRPQDSTDRHYLVQPLSHPPLPSHPNYPPTIIKSSELEIRPWIAWSVPRFTNDGLNNLYPPAQYETIDWQALKDRRYGNGDLEVDGSILAAKMVDSSYSPFGKARIDRSQVGITEFHYDGIYLGAEKIWVGDPIRLSIGSGIDIMVLHSVIEREHASDPKKTPHLQFLGDVYTLQTIPHNNGNIPTLASPQNNPHLPSRLTDDLAYRNARSIPMKGSASYWKLASPQTRVEINDVKGRWYEVSLILPILHPDIFAEAFRKGELQEVTLWMNSRGDCINANIPVGQPRLPRVNRRVEEGRRVEAFGRSLPEGVVFIEGNSPPPSSAEGAGKVEEEGQEEGKLEGEDIVIDPRFETADGAGGREGEEKGLEEFMNLDRFEGEFEGERDGGGSGFF